MTIQPIRYKDLGQADLGWLKARYHFSFARYHNPERRGFGDLRVINDDIVSSGAGFDMHAHDNMEIITYVRQGAITHKDSLGNEGKTAAGDIQVMSAGSGIRHAEYNQEDTETRLYQIWIKPNKQDVVPRWATAKFPRQPVEDTLPLLVTGDPEHKERDDILFIHADAAVYGGRIRPDKRIVQNINKRAYLLVSEGKVKVDGIEFKSGDGAEIASENEITVTAAGSGADVLVITLEH